MLSCSLRTVLETLPARSCGSRSTSQGQLEKSFSRSENYLKLIPFCCRNHVPWIIIGICYALCMSLLLTIRYVLSSENKRRDNEPIDDTYDDVYIERIGKEGQTERIKVDKVRFWWRLNLMSGLLTPRFQSGIPGPDGYSESRFQIRFVTFKFMCA